MTAKPEPSPLEPATEAAYRAYIGRGYIPELDGLRAFSVLLVVSAHMKDDVWGWLAGQRGVVIFFVLSGYLITMLSLREERTRGAVNIPAFFVRRFFRLFPLYYFVLGLYCVLVLGLGWWPDQYEGMYGALPYLATYMQEWPFFLGINGSHNYPFYQSWTLGIEEKYYLVWPFLAFLALRQSRAGRRNVTAVLTALAAAMPILFTSPIGRFIHPYSSILIGCSIALLLDDPAWFATLSRLGRPIFLAAALALLIAFHLFIPYQADFASENLYSLCAGLFLTALLLSDGPVQRVLRRPSWVLLGRLSYAIYLIHLFGVNLAEYFAPPGSDNRLVSTAALGLAWIFSIAMAYLLHITIEQPFITVGKALSARIMDGGLSRARQPKRVA